MAVTARATKPDGPAPHRSPFGNTFVTVERLSVAIIFIAFLCAEAWQPTQLRPKHYTTADLIIASESAGGSARKTTLGTNLLDDLPRIDALPLGNIDAVISRERRIVPRGDGSFSMPRTADAQIVGWFADSQARNEAAAVFPILDGRRLGDADLTYGITRFDVGRFYGTSNLDSSGFALRLPAGSLGPGRHKVEFGVVSSDRRGYFLAPEVLVLGASQ